VNARVGAAGTLHSNRLSEYPLKSRFESRLNRIVIRLQLPARVIGAVVFEGDADSHGSSQFITRPVSAARFSTIQTAPSAVRRVLSSAQKIDPPASVDLPLTRIAS
jgi:hypothetical protein